MRGGPSVNADMTCMAFAQQYMLMNTGGPPNTGSRKSATNQLRMQPVQTSQSTVAAAAAAAAAATEKQDLGAMVKQLSRALIHPKKAAPNRGGSHREGDSTEKELVKLEEGNQRLLRRVLHRLRRRRSRARGDSYRRSYMEGLEKSNEMALQGISQRLADLSQETRHK